VGARKVLWNRTTLRRSQRGPSGLFGVQTTPVSFSLKGRATLLRALATDAAGELDVLGHDGDALGVDGAQVGVLEEADQVGLSWPPEGPARRSPGSGGRS
jgi:hypothetical protein